jgi:hypothetical protein
VYISNNMQLVLSQSLQHIESLSSSTVSLLVPLLELVDQGMAQNGREVQLLMFREPYGFRMTARNLYFYV